MGEYCYFLGGQDLEMVTIRELLEDYAPDRIHDKHLSWGAKASAYRNEISACLSEGGIPVLIELEDDINLDHSRVIFVDHHGERAGGPTSLHQIFGLLGLPKEKWTRRFDLVEANDSGYIPALIEAGATEEEIISIRAADRRAQGITELEEKAGEAAIAGLDIRAGGALTIVRLSHSHTAVVTDRLEPALGGPGYENLLVISPGEVNFFGVGDLVRALEEAFPDGWSGGALPERGFWGHLLGRVSAQEVVGCLAHHLETRQRQPISQHS